MKRITLFLLLFVTIASFTSCKKDKYLDWKYLNEQWLNEHREEAGWITTESGLQYRKIKDGIGDFTPSWKSYVIVSYTGSYVTGKTFETTEGGYLKVSDVVPGMQEALKMMKQNSIYELRIPQDIAYGKDGSGAIPPYSVLLFRIELSNFGNAE